MRCACGGDIFYEDESECFDCRQTRNPYLGVRFSIELGSEDSTDPRRVADGSSKFNVALPGIEKDGKYRPVANNELATARSRREYAKRHGLEPMERAVKKAVG
jgi:hypothetical protein